MGFFMNLLGFSGNIADVDTNKNVMVSPSREPGSIGYVVAGAEIDDGSISGTQEFRSIDIDDDYKTRIGGESVLDASIFNYAAQNTGKHTYTTTTVTGAWTAGGFIMNSGNGVAVNTGMTFGTHKAFPLLGAQTLYAEQQSSFSAFPQTNVLVDFGLFVRGATTAFAPADGIYFRITSAGFIGVVNHNGTETQSGVFDFTLVPNKKYQFIIQLSERVVHFWIDNVRMGDIPTPDGQGRPCMSATLPWSMRFAIVGGAASGAFQMTTNSTSLTQFGPIVGDTAGSIGNRVFGCYEGLSGGTMGSLANYANSANPGAAVPTNTTAALGVGLGGQFWETATMAVTTDGVIMSYLNPLGTVNVHGRRLVINGIWLQSYVQTVLVGGPVIAQWSLAFGHTSLSLATNEGVAAKAPRRIPLPAFTQVITAAQAVSTMINCPGLGYMDFSDSPIYVNAGEYVALVKKYVGTVLTGGVIAHVIAFNYGWE